MTWLIENKGLGRRGLNLILASFGGVLPFLPPGSRPFLQGLCALPGTPPRQKARDGQILVKLWPVNIRTIAGEF